MVFGSEANVISDVGIGILDRVADSPPIRRLLAAPGPVRTAIAAVSGHPLVAAALARALEAPVLAVAHEPRAAESLAAGAGLLLGSDRVVMFPAWESLPYEGISPGPHAAGERSRAAHRLRTATGPFVAVAPILAAIQGLSPDLGTHEPLVLRVDDVVTLEDLASRLVQLGYARSDLVEHRGEFAVRGGIVDVFPSTARRPVRAEFDGDRVESLRSFSPATQLSTGAMDAVDVHPSRELIVTDDVRARAEAAIPSYRGHLRVALERLAEGLAFEGMEQAIPLLHDRLPLLADLLPEGGWVVVSSAPRTMDRGRRIQEEADALAEASAWPGPRVVRDPDVALGGRQRVDVTELAGPEAVDLGIHPWDRPGRTEEMVARTRELSQAGATVILTAEGRGSLERATEVLGPDTPSTRVQADVSEGFWFAPDPNSPPLLALLTEEDLFGRRRHTRVAPRLSRRRSEGVAVELSPGDLAVHRVHGVGRYLGMVRRAVAGAERDYLLLEYAEGDKQFQLLGDHLTWSRHYSETWMKQARDFVARKARPAAGSPAAGPTVPKSPQ